MQAKVAVSTGNRPARIARPAGTRPSQKPTSGTASPGSVHAAAKQTAAASPLFAARRSRRHNHSPTPALPAATQATKSGALIEATTHEVGSAIRPRGNLEDGGVRFGHWLRPDAGR